MRKEEEYSAELKERASRAGRGEATSESGAAESAPRARVERVPTKPSGLLPAGQAGNHARCLLIPSSALPLAPLVASQTSNQLSSSSLALSSLPDPVQAIQEMARVCKPDGRVLLLESGRSNRKWLGTWQDKRVRRHAKFFGTHMNRDPLQLVEEAGLPVLNAKRTFWGILHHLVLDPTADNGNDNGHANGNGNGNGHSNGNGNGNGH